MRLRSAMVATLLLFGLEGPRVRALTFAEAGAAAVAASEDLRAERTALALREGAWLLSLRSYLPKLSLSAAEDDRVSTVGADSFAKTFGVGAEQLLWDGGAIAASRAMEKAELEYARAALGRKAQEIAASAVSAYRKTLVASAVASVKRDGVSYLRDQRRILEAEVSSGLARQDELAEAELSVSEAELAASSAELDEEDAASALAEALSVTTLPPLSERIDVERPAPLPENALLPALVDRARSANPDVAAARLELLRKSASLRAAYAARHPTVSLSANARLSGDRYPLTRASWNVGLNFEFSGAFLGGSGSAGFGAEPPFGRSANTAATLVPFPDPTAALNVRSAEASLSFERERLARTVGNVGRLVEACVHRCSLLDRRRELARAGRALSLRKLKLVELESSLGRATRMDAMEARIAADKAAVALVDAAAALSEGESELERLLNLEPGALERFVSEARRRRVE